MHTILVIDDDRFVLRLISDQLVQMGYRVRAVASPTEALSQELGDVSAILCDQTMPGLLGVEVLQRVREQKGFRAPFIFITSGEVSEALVQGAIRYDAEFLSKPVDFTVLRNLLRTALQRR